MTDVEATHEGYARLKSDHEMVSLMMDEEALKKRCSSDGGGEGSMLKIPLGQVREDKAKQRQLYENYLEHAFLPQDIVTDAMEEMTGICFKIDPVINLPDRIQYLETHANARGDSLRAVAESVLRDLLASKRTCVETNYLSAEQRATVDHKPSLSLINWAKNSTGYTMMVFSESYTDNDGEKREQRRRYGLENGVLATSLFRQEKGGKWAEVKELDSNGNQKPAPSLPNNKPYSFIPIRVGETLKPALLGMARTVHKGFKLSAAYFATLHGLSPTLVIKTDQEASALAVGFENGIKLGQKDSADLLQQGTDGAGPQREAMERMFNSAVDQGVRLVSESSSQQSGEAIYLRNANKQIKIDSVAREASTQIKEALRVAAMLESVDPNEVEFELVVELIQEPKDVAVLKEMREAIADGNLIRWSDYLLRAHDNEMVTLDKNPDGTLDTDGYIKKATEEAKLMNAEAGAV